ncbi:MAG TPA: hypothetical protein VFB22_01240 [Candidatus Baltobacteraceae bacterium]|nr:hypothetical protein [Candidatus Baltobacteraceae bacterium]
MRARDTGELLLLGALKNFGIDDAGAARLIALHGADRCWPQVRAMRLRLEQHHAAGDPIRHPGRFLRRAIEQNYELPDALRAELVAVPPPRRSAVELETQRVAEELDEQQIRDVIGTLPPRQLAELSAKAAAEVDENFVMRASRGPARDAAIRARIVRLARESLVTTR